MCQCTCDRPPPSPPVLRFPGVPAATEMGFVLEQKHTPPSSSAGGTRSLGSRLSGVQKHTDPKLNREDRDGHLTQAGI